MKLLFLTIEKYVVFFNQIKNSNGS